MRRIGWIMVLLMAAGLATGAAAEGSRGLVVPLRGSEAAGAQIVESVELYTNSYALVVGIDNYTDGWPRLAKAKSDATQIARALEARGFGVTLATDLTADRLGQVFEDFFIEKGRDPSARLFVWFAGHGHTDERGEGYLIPADAALPSERVKFLRKALSLRRFGEFVRLAESKHVFSVFDSCFAGTIFSVARAAPPPQITRITSEPVRQFMTSGDAGQQVSDDGTFARLFIEALDGKRRADLNGDGYLTGTELGAFLDSNMSNYSSNRQTPRYGKLRSPDYDRGDFVFALPDTLAPGIKVVRATPPEAAPPAPDKETVFWQSISGSDRPADFEAYLRSYPKGAFAALARSRLAALGPPAWQRSAAAEYRGEMTNNVRDRPDRVITRLEIAGGKLIGSYTVHEPDGATRGTLSDFRQTGEQRGTFRWRDAYGTGTLEVTFDRTTQSFTGKWRPDDAPEAGGKWTGKR